MGKTFNFRFFLKYIFECSPLSSWKSLDCLTTTTKNYNLTLSRSAYSDLVTLMHSVYVLPKKTKIQQVEFGWE